MLYLLNLQLNLSAEINSKVDIRFVLKYRYGLWKGRSEIKVFVSILTLIYKVNDSYQYNSARQHWGYWLIVKLEFVPFTLSFCLQKVYFETCLSADFFGLFQVITFEQSRMLKRGFSIIAENYKIQVQNMEGNCQLQNMKHQ